MDPKSGSGCWSRKPEVPSVDDGVKAGVPIGKGDTFEASRLSWPVDGRYSHTVPCFTQFAQFGFCSSHLKMVSRM
jgi:hypothetical protein